MKRFRGVLVVVAVSMCMAVPATAASINIVEITTANPYGLWATGYDAAIGISVLGALDNPFLDDDATGALPSAGIPSGTYLAFLGYDYLWPATPADAAALGTTAELILYYTDSTTRSATFQVGDIHASGGWTQLPGGDPLLFLGGGGFVSTPDRVGLDRSITPTDGLPDVVLEFSDNGGVPEPGTLFLAGAAMVALGLMRRKFRA